MRNSFEVLYHFYTIQYILGLLSLCFFTEVTQNVWFTEIHDDWSDMADRAWVTISFHDWMFWPSRSNGSVESRRAQGKGGQWYIREATISWPAKCKESFYVYHTWVWISVSLILQNLVTSGMWKLHISETMCESIHHSQELKRWKFFCLDLINPFLQKDFFYKIRSRPAFSWIVGRVKFEVLNWQ